MELFNYFRSSASYRVRIALALKGLPYDYKGVHLVRNEQLDAPYAALSPQRLVPLLPADPVGRARVRSLALDVACEIHPLNNLRVLRYLVKELGASEDAKNAWYRHWVESGLEVIERRLNQEPGTGRHCHGDTPTLADCLLVPQIFNAQRFDCRLDHVPTVMRVFDACMAHPAFQAAQPSACPDADA